MVEVRVLGQLLVMQTVVESLPDRRSMLEFVSRGLMDVPGVEAVTFCGPGEIDEESSPVRFPLQTSQGCLGAMCFRITDAEAFEPYKGHLRNFCFSLAVMLERLEQRERLEELVEDLAHATEVKDAFLANMSHELRTPLNSIIGFSGILAEGLAGDLSEEQRRQVEMINSSGRHLLVLINDLLDLSRIEIGEIGLHVEEFSPTGVVDEVVGMMRPLAEEKGIALETEVEGRVGSIRSDRVRVEQILFNLLGNAVKFTEDGGVGLRLRPDGDDHLVFEVSDTGVGIRQEDLPHLFEDFFQSNGKSAGNVEGAGLGLAVSRRLSEALGGSIHAESQPGAGSTFTLLLPRDAEGVSSR